MSQNQEENKSTETRQSARFDSTYTNKQDRNIKDYRQIRNFKTATKNILKI